jgi:hypothetical protein
MAYNKTKGKVEENIGKVEVNGRQRGMGFNKRWGIEGKNRRDGLIFGERKEMVKEVKIERDADDVACSQ